MVGSCLQGRGAGEELRGAEAELAGEGVVEFEADAVEGAFPPVVKGDDKGAVLHQVRGVADEEAALVQGFEDQGDIPLLQVAHAAVDEFGAAAGGAAGKVLPFEEEGAVAATRRLHRRAEAGGTAADDDHIPARLLLQLL